MLKGVNFYVRIGKILIVLQNQLQSVVVGLVDIMWVIGNCIVVYGLISDY